MDDLTDDEILIEAIADVTFDVLSRIGDDPDARYAFFKRFVELAMVAVEQSTKRCDSSSDPTFFI